jgi:hypothetical protein
VACCGQALGAAGDGESVVFMFANPMPYRLFAEMEASVDASFLATAVWRKLCERW